MICVPQLCRNRLVDVANLFSAILLPMFRCMSHGKSEKVEKEKALNHHKQESNKKGCVGKFTER